MENIKIVDEIIKYYMNPKKYPNSNRITIENAIKQLDEVLINGVQDATNGLIDTLYKKYTSEGLDAPINATILKTRADDQGLSATKGYRDIYFNEIIQNANDNSTGNDLDIILSKEGNIYEIAFQYDDRGFSTENIIGLFNTEIHTKRDNFSATGKHGVGIKSLFYFIDYMRIESNVEIEFSIMTEVEDEIEKIREVKSKIKNNEKWYQTKDKRTTFTIRFPEKDSYGKFNVGKLKDFVNLCLQDKENHFTEIEKYLFGLEQNSLIFDVRGLLFTDKNKGKQTGIKKLSFYKDTIESKLFEISCAETEKFETDSERVCKVEIKYNDNVKLSYILFTKEGEEGEQNFSVAFPMELGITNRRYYETYYIPQADELGVNILINSKYSNVARTKLTDDDNENGKIKEDIENALVELYTFMVSEECATSCMGIEISILFHKLLLIDEKFVKQCYNNSINNRYLVKYKDITNVITPIPYIVYRRNEKEEFERKLIGQKFGKDESVDFLNQYIFQKDSIKYDENLFITQICGIYRKAFNEQEQEELKNVLNVAGTIRDLIYYRVHKNFPIEQEVMLDDAEVDDWNENVWNTESDCESRKTQKVLISLSMIGRYKLHSYLTATGEITGASFYEYLFNQEQNNKDTNYSKYPTLRNTQKQLYGKQYGKLKEELMGLLVNRDNSGTVGLFKSDKYNGRYEKGTIIFYGSQDMRASYYMYYGYNNSVIYDYYDKDNRLNSNTDSFGIECTELFIKKIIDEKELQKHTIEFKDNLMLVSSDYPLWGRPTDTYWRNDILQTGEWFKCKLININFIRKIYAHSWEYFSFYVKNFLEYQNSEDGIVKKYGKFNLYTYRQEKPLFNIDINEVSKVFKFFYENSRYQKNEKGYEIDFRINLIGDIKNNLCPDDYYKYLIKRINKKVYVMQTNRVNAGNEIMYWHEQYFNIWGVGKWTPIGIGIRAATDEILIIHNEKMDYKEAIRKVLEKILDENDVLDKCDAFIAAGQNYAIQGEEYDNLTSWNNDGNQRSLKNINIKNPTELSCKALKKIITARGNNDNTCCCCGKHLTNEKLIITNNSNDKTNKDYPQIVEVVCEKCEEVLRKSHKSTKLIHEDGSYYVNYCCDIHNSHQNKEVIFKVKICDGVLSLCRG